MNYPEHEKLKDVSKLSQQLGSFIEWGQMNGLVLCQYDEETDQYRSSRKTINELLSAFYRIDLMKLESEKEHMLNEVRKLNNV